MVGVMMHEARMHLAGPAAEIKAATGLNPRNGAYISGTTDHAYATLTPTKRQAQQIVRTLAEFAGLRVVEGDKK